MNWLTLPSVFAIAGASFAVTFLLYLLQPARRKVLVAYVGLFRDLQKSNYKTALFGRLSWLWSLFLHWLILALLLAALYELSARPSAHQKREFLLLIDAGLSMQATDAAPSRLEAAKAEARRWIMRMDPDDSALIVEAGVVPLPRSGVSSSRQELLSAVDRVSAQDCAAALDQALAFAEDVLRQHDGEIVLLSDATAFWRYPELAKPRKNLRLIPFGKAQANLAISAFAARREPKAHAQTEVMVQVHNFGAQAARAKLTLESDGNVIAFEELQVAPSGQELRVFRELSGAAKHLQAKLESVAADQNWLSADDNAQLLLPPQKRARVLLVSAGNTYLEAASLLDETFELSQSPSLPADYANYDLLIFDGVAPELAAGPAALYVNPAPGGFIHTGKALANFGFDNWERKHGLLSNLALGDVQVAKGYALLAKAGERGLAQSEGHNILLEGKRGAQRYWALGFDPKDSDFVLRPAWPLFILNLVRSVSETTLEEFASFRTGARISLKTQKLGPRLRLLGPNPHDLATELSALDGSVSLIGKNAGIYRLFSLEQPAQPALEFAVNIVNPDASVIAPYPATELAALKPQAPDHETQRPRRYWIYWLLAAAALSLLEWGTFHRRISV